MQDLPEKTDRAGRGGRVDLVGAGVGVMLVAVSVVIPLISSEHWRKSLNAATAPIYGWWWPHVGWGTGPAIVLALLVIGFGPTVANRLSWRRLLWASWGCSLAWAFSLAMVDGWQTGFAGRLEYRTEYLYEVPGVTDVSAMLREFSARIVDFQPDSWTTQVSGHPPAALLFFVMMDRLGLRGGGWAGMACMLIGCSAVAAVAVALRALGAEQRARAALPFLVLAPAVIWIAVSADALFAGVVAWAVALLAIATGESKRWPVAAVASGVLFGVGMYLNYGLVLMGIFGVAVLVAGRTVRPLAPALVGALLVVATFTASGFWWLTGYQRVVRRYYQGIASQRPITYWWWANLAATTCSVGFATPAALHRVFAPALVRLRDPAVLLALAGLCAIVVADVSALSKAETERIWLPFDVWLLPATAFLPPRTVRGWLAAQAVVALLINHLLFTSW